MIDCFSWPRVPGFATAKAWLETAGFTAKQAPPLIVAWWSRGTGAIRDVFKRMLYDSMHCVDIGLMDYFMEAVIATIVNSWDTKEKGDKALSRFESRIGSIPPHDTGYRLFRR